MTVMLVMIVTTAADNPEGIINEIFHEGKLNETMTFEVKRGMDSHVSFSGDTDTAEDLWTVELENVAGVDGVEDPPTVYFVIRQANQVKSFRLPQSYSDRGKRIKFKIGRRVTDICPFNVEKNSKLAIWMSTYSNQTIQVKVKVTVKSISDWKNWKGNDNTVGMYAIYNYNDFSKC